jgi:hypothetical protein
MSVDEIVILRIELEDIEPAIWRQVAVRAVTSLAGLHRIIQAAMGWLDYHLWEFEIGDTTYGVPDPDGFDWGREIKPASATKLATILNRGIDEFTYTYDMGDNWQHRVTVERIDQALPDRLYPEFRFTFSQPASYEAVRRRAPALAGAIVFVLARALFSVVCAEPGGPPLLMPVARTHPGGPGTEGKALLCGHA